ncbi:hypothetical protein SAMN05421847_1751 [Halpernia humi]|uniref:Uncharacterized protein n=1 Tax=Halpernia humi TaxID=493375 RepID=A0A1H5YAX1_9FLAO|nr:hypothetical protein [Halpernia humi]SEG21138.1 hypothetical protein SAMN05421847_1751 [Halpernia humi]
MGKIALRDDFSQRTVRLRRRSEKEVFNFLFRTTAKPNRTLCVISKTLAQNKFDSLTSKTKNLEWMRILENTKNKSEQIKLIIKKIKTDSIVPQNLTGINLKIRDGEFNPDKCKILNFLENNEHMILLDLNLNPNFSIILNVLNSETIKKIKILNRESAMKLYGNRGNCGAVIMHSDKRKLSSEIGELQERLE